MVSVALSLGFGIAPVYPAAVSGSPCSYKLLYMRCSDFPPRVSAAVTCPSEQAEDARKRRFCQSISCDIISKRRDMKKWLYLGIFFFLLGFGLWKFWCLGSVPMLENHKFVLNIDHPGVEIRRKGQEQWATAQSGQELFPGDSLHTDGEGNATIQLFGQGEARLGKKTDITIAEASRENTLNMRLELGLGRIWTRLRRFSGLEDRFRIERNGVIATVRGTSFDVQGFSTSTQVWVSESAVSIEAKDTRHVLLEGYMANAKTDGVLGKDEVITDDSRQAEWFQKNVNRDQEYDQSYTRELQKRYQDRQGAEPQTIHEALTRLSEWTHSVLQPSQADRLYPLYTGRRLFKISELARRGSEGLALQEYGTIEEEIFRRLQDNPAIKPAIRQEIEAISDMLADVTPSSSAYRLKQRIEDIRLRLASGDPLAEAYARLLAVQARLFEASNLISESSLDDAGTALDAARQGIENVTRDIERIKQGGEGIDVLRDKVQVLRMREGALRIRLATAIAPPKANVAAPTMESMVSTSTAQATTTPAIEPPTSTAAVAATTTSDRPVTPEPPAPVAPVLRTLQLSPGVSSLHGNGSISFQAMAIYTDGTRKDVTDVSLMSASNLRLGFFLRNTFTANPDVEGQVDIAATYTESNKTVRAQASVTIRP